MAINHQNIIGEKDKQLADYQKQIEGLQKAQSDLSKQIEEQKAKNNVSIEKIVYLSNIFLIPENSSPIHSYLIFKLNCNLIFSLHT